MNSIKVLVKFLRQNLIKNIIIIIQVCFSIYVLTTLLTQIVKYFDTSSMLSKMDLDNMIIFSESLHIQTLMQAEQRTEKYESVREYLKKLDGVENVFNVYTTQVKLENQNYNTILYDEGLLEKIKFDLKLGQNFNKENLNNNITPIIVTEALEERYKLNNIYELSIYSIPDDNMFFVNVQVIGILKNGAYIYSGASQQTVPQVTDLFIETYDKEQLIIMPNKLVKTENYIINDGFTIELNDKKKFMEKSYDKVIEDGIGKFTKEDEYGNNFFESFIGNYDYYIYLFISIYLFILISVGGYNLLATLNYKRLFTIYFINGMTWKKGIILITLRNFLVIMIPTILTSVLCNLSVAIDNGTKFNYKILIITIVLYIIVFLVTTIGTMTNLVKVRPSETLKEVE